jgi:hypothetical protein
MPIVPPAMDAYMRQQHQQSPDHMVSREMHIHSLVERLAQPPPPEDQFAHVHLALALYELFDASEVSVPCTAHTCNT